MHFGYKLRPQFWEAIYANLCVRRPADGISVHKAGQRIEEARIKQFPNSPVNFTIWLLLTAGGATKWTLEDSKVTVLKQLPVEFDILPGNFHMIRHKGESLCSLKDHSTNLFMLFVSVFVLTRDINAQKVHEHWETFR
jgi:hypothetical protein